MSRDAITAAVSIGLIILGILLILGEFTVKWLLGYAGIVLIVLGILILLGTLPGGTLIGVVALVVGILMLQDIIPLPNDFMRASADVLRVINVVAGAILVALGVMRLSHSKS